MFNIYIFLSSLYRFASGALGIALSWIVSTSQSSSLELGILIILTFLPAVIIPYIWKTKPNIDNCEITALGCLFSGILSIFIYFFTNKIYLAIILNTFIWIFFFILESSWEAWFSEISKKYENNDVHKYSSLSFLFNQLALMSGPLVLSYLTNKNTKFIILISATLFILCAGLCFLVNKKIYSNCLNFNEENEKKIIPSQLRCYEYLNQKLLNMRVLFSLMLVWPLLASFNYMVPLQMVFFNKSIMEVSYLDASIGLGMAAMSIILGYSINFSHTMFTKSMGFVLLFLSVILWYFASNMYFRCLSVFLLGFSFNYTRIYIRKYLSSWTDAYEVGNFVSKANSFAFPLICVVITLQHYVGIINWFMPYFLCFVIYILIPKEILIRNH